MSLFDPEVTFHWFNSWGGEGHAPFCHNITMNDQPAYEVPAPGLPFPPREKRAHGWPTKCVKSWLDGLLRWEQELLGSQGENSAEFPAPDGTLDGKPAKLLKVTTIGALRHTLECAYAYIRELEDERRNFDAVETERIKAVYEKNQRQLERILNRLRLKLDHAESDKYRLQSSVDSLGVAYSRVQEDNDRLSKQLQETEDRCVTLAAAASHHAAATTYANAAENLHTQIEDMKAKERNIARDRQLLADPKTPRKKFWAAYQRLVLTVESKVNPWTHQDFTLNEREDHAHTGFLTELGEILDIEKKQQFYGKPYDINHITEEIGDLLWYAALYSWVNYQVEPGHNRFLNSKKETGGYAVDSAWIIKDHIKCLMGRISNWNSWAADTFMPEVRMVRDMYRAHGCDIPPLREIARRNIFKLLDARYKSGSFSQEEAVNRDLANEAEKLRGSGVDGSNTRVPEPTEGFDASDAIPLAVITTAGTGQDPDTQAEFNPEDFNSLQEYVEDKIANERAEEGFAPDEPLDDDEYDDEMGSDLYEEYEED